MKDILEHITYAKRKNSGILIISDETMLNIIEELLEKNTPKKPILLTHSPLIQSGWKYGCPSCKLAVGVNSYSFDYTDEDEYCPSCGQKLNWD